ncbi:MAG: glycosyl hydrolase [Candidatus Eremiobacteraeota bacterium]|nr:glycosyl hydrolase [Candidatus Eremiobacteraeota bacterium]
MARSSNYPTAFRRTGAKSFGLVAASLAVAALPAAAQSAAPSAQTVIAALHWRNVGPGIGGRSVAVDAVPGTPFTFYFGGVDGGVWRSTNYGLTWTNITDGQLNGSNSIGALAVAPSDPKTIYIGTGEADIRNTFITGDGVYKTTDAGKTWHYAGLRDTHTVAKIVIDPHDAKLIYAASMGHVYAKNAERGIFKSTDGGAHWSRVLYVDDATGACDLVMDSSHPKTLYAAMWQAYRTPYSLNSGGPGSGLYRTTDGGRHWTKISSNPGFATGTLGRIGVSVAASNPNVVYAIVQAKNGGIFRSEDRGAHWKLVNDSMEMRQRAFYYMAIYADPTDPNRIYVPNARFFVSKDGGKNFSLLRPPHGDNHVVWIDPHNPRIILEGNDGGATVSSDRGETWSSEHNQLTAQFYHVALDEAFPFNIYGAQQDEGSFEGPSASSGGTILTTDWRRTALGESTFIAPQPGNTNVDYGSGYFSIMMRHDAVTDEYNSVSPYPLYREGASSGELEDRLAWTHPIFFSPVNRRELLLGAQHVLSSTDYGQTWRKISPDLTRNDKNSEAASGGPIDNDASSAEVYPYISALAVSPLDGDELWAGSVDGLVHVSTDHGATWNAITPPELPQWAEITSIEPSHTDKRTAYLTASRYQYDDFHPFIYKTTDLGKSWTSLSSSLPSNQYLYTIRQDPNAPNLFFLTTKSTIFVSFDGAANWQPLTLNLPNVQVRDVAINTREGKLVIATHGRSMWVLDNLTLLEQLTRPAPAAANGAVLYAPERAWLTHAYGAPLFGGSPNASGNGENPAFGATVIFYVPRSYDGKTPVSLTFKDSAGNVVRSFALHAKSHAKPETPSERYHPTEDQARAYARLTGIAPGMNLFQWDLRYPDAAEVTGFEPSGSGGGLDDSLLGPQIVPGNYTVTLAYGGAQISQPFALALDPRSAATAQDLAARRDLGLKIHALQDELDRAVNAAVAARARVGATGAAAAQLDAAIGSVVDIVHPQADEGALLYESRLRNFIAYLNAEVDTGYVRPTAAEYAVFDRLSADAASAEARLKAAIVGAP